MDLYQARKQYRLVCERPNKGNKAIEREIVASYQVAQTATIGPGSTCCGFTSEAQLRKLGQAPTETIGMSRQVYTLSLENLNPTSGGHASPR